MMTLTTLRNFNINNSWKVFDQLQSTPHYIDRILLENYASKLCVNLEYTFSGASETRKPRQPSPNRNMIETRKTYLNKVVLDQQQQMKELVSVGLLIRILSKF